MIYPTGEERQVNRYSHSKVPTKFPSLCQAPYLLVDQSTLYKQKMKRTSEFSFRLKCLVFWGKKLVNPNRS